MLTPTEPLQPLSNHKNTHTQHHAGRERELKIVSLTIRKSRTQRSEHTHTQDPVRSSADSNEISQTAPLSCLHGNKVKMMSINESADYCVLLCNNRIKQQRWRRQQTLTVNVKSFITSFIKKEKLFKYSCMIMCHSHTQHNTEQP